MANGGFEPMHLIRLIGFITGIVVLILGVLILIGSALSPRQIINGIYQIIFGLFIMICELRLKLILSHFYFLTHFLGLGLFYIFVGGLALGGEWYQITVACVLLGMGIIYMGLGCMNRRMGDEYIISKSGAAAANKSAANKSVSKSSKDRAASSSTTDKLAKAAVSAHNDGREESASVTRMKETAAKKAIESAFASDTHNPFAD